MSTLDSMLERNMEFAGRESAAGTLIPTLPRASAQVKAMIIGCVDMRVDPGQLLQLGPGEALVMRNVGGRITPVVLEELGMLGRIGQVMGGPVAAGGEFHLIVLHHTDCGITRLVGETAMLAHFFQVGEEAVAAKAVGDAQAAVAADVALLKGVKGLPGGWIVSGLVYDVVTGLVEVVVPAGVLRAGLRCLGLRFRRHELPP